MATELITSPTGKISFAALNRLVKRSPTAEQPSVYTIRLEFNGNEAEGAAYRKAIEVVNPGLIGTKHASAKGYFTVQASTKYQPEVYTTEGEQLSTEEIPSIESGQASMVVSPYTGNKLGGSLNLTAVVLGDIQEWEGNQDAADDRRAAVLAAINKFKAP